MNFYIAIPTHDRPQMIQEKTLRYLDEAGVDWNNVFIFLSTKNDWETYPDMPGHRIRGVPKIGRQRNNMRQFFPEGQRVLYMDDDVDAFYRLVQKNGAKRKAPVVDNLVDIVESCFDYCAETGYRLWGMQKTDNPFYLKPCETVKPAMITSTVFGEINTRDDRFNVHVSHGDDFELSLLHAIYNGGMVRYNWLTIPAKGNCFENPGGITWERENGGWQSDIATLQSLYGDMVKVGGTAHGDIPDLKINYGKITEIQRLSRLGN